MELLPNHRMRFSGVNRLKAEHVEIAFRRFHNLCLPFSQRVRRATGTMAESED